MLLNQQFFYENVLVFKKHWKAKFDMTQSIIKEGNGKSLKPKKIPGLLTASKIKAQKKCSKYESSLNLCFYGKEKVMNAVESLKKRKKEKVIAKAAKETKTSKQ